MSQEPCAISDRRCGVTARRSFLLAGLAALPSLLVAGCTPAASQSARAMPGPAWRPRPSDLDRGLAELDRPAPAEQTGMPGVVPRSRWTTASASPANMNRMTPIHSITVHHDGMSPYFASDERSTVGRLESIRRAHRDRRNWGDIGYHFAIDRSGRVYECRSLAWQGAHVRDYNEGNIGVLALGNFDEQSPTDAQLESLRQHVVQLQRTYNVSASRVLTHKEWPGAITACPGRALQAHMQMLRSRRMLA